MSAPGIQMCFFEVQKTENDASLVRATDWILDNLTICNIHSLQVEHPEDILAGRLPPPPEAKVCSRVRLLRNNKVR